MKDFEHFHSDSKHIGADFLWKYLAFVIIITPFVPNNHHIPLDRADMGWLHKNVTNEVHLQNLMALSLALSGNGLIFNEVNN